MASHSSMLPFGSGKKRDRSLSAPPSPIEHSDDDTAQFFVRAPKKKKYKPPFIWDSPTSPSPLRKKSRGNESLFLLPEDRNDAFLGDCHQKSTSKSQLPSSLRNTSGDSILPSIEEPDDTYIIECKGKSTSNSLSPVPVFRNPFADRQVVLLSNDEDYNAPASVKSKPRALGSPFQPGPQKTWASRLGSDSEEAYPFVNSSQKKEHSSNKKSLVDELASLDISDSEFLEMSSLTALKKKTKSQVISKHVQIIEISDSDNSDSDTKKPSFETPKQAFPQDADTIELVEVDDDDELEELVSLSDSTSDDEPDGALQPRTKKERGVNLNDKVLKELKPTKATALIRQLVS